MLGGLQRTCKHNIPRSPPGGDPNAGRPTEDMQSITDHVHHHEETQCRVEAQATKGRGPSHNQLQINRVAAPSPGQATCHKGFEAPHDMKVTTPPQKMLIESSTPGSLGWRDRLAVEKPDSSVIPTWDNKEEETESKG